MTRPKDMTTSPRSFKKKTQPSFRTLSKKQYQKSLYVSVLTKKTAPFDWKSIQPDLAGPMAPPGTKRPLTVTHTTGAGISPITLQRVC
jgi:hypothetical protein